MSDAVHPECRAGVRLGDVDPLRGEEVRRLAGFDAVEVPRAYLELQRPALAEVQIPAGGRLIARHHVAGNRNDIARHSLARYQARLTVLSQPCHRPALSRAGFRPEPATLFGQLVPSSATPPRT